MTLAAAINAEEARPGCENPSACDAAGAKLCRRCNMRALHRAGAFSRDRESKPAKPQRRFETHHELEPGKVRALHPNHPAAREGRTLFPSTVVRPELSDRLLVSGHNQRKLGDRIVKGLWSGFPIYSLTLEERATCPRSCQQWLTCYGAGMQFARRHAANENLTVLLEAELCKLNARHPDGFAVRLHTLGDFCSVGYVQYWRAWLDRYPALHCFGYTAWQPDTPIGQSVLALANERWSRFAIRLSATEPGSGNVVTVWRKPEEIEPQPGVIVCPAQTGASDCCGTCGLCWAPAARDKTIAFIGHGPQVKTGPRKVRTPRARLSDEERLEKRRAYMREYMRKKAAEKRAANPDAHLPRRGRASKPAPVPKVDPLKPWPAEKRAGPLFQPEEIITRRPPQPRDEMRNLTARLQGDPAPGRSALDQLRAQGVRL